MNEELLIGLVSISDRAAGGVYEDQGFRPCASGSARRWPRPGAWRTG